MQALNVNLVFTTFVVVFGSSFQFGYNIGVLNQVEQVRSYYETVDDNDVRPWSLVLIMSFLPFLP